MPLSLLEGVTKLRRVARWSEFQRESWWDHCTTIAAVVEVYEIVTVHFDCDSIEDAISSCAEQPHAANMAMLDRLAVLLGRTASIGKARIMPDHYEYNNERDPDWLYDSRVDRED